MGGRSRLCRSVTRVLRQLLCLDNVREKIGAEAPRLRPAPALLSPSVSAGVYEPVHGSAPDIAGQNKANPLAQVRMRAGGRIVSRRALQTLLASA